MTFKLISKIEYQICLESSFDWIGQIKRVRAIYLFHRDFAFDRTIEWFSSNGNLERG